MLFYKVPTKKLESVAAGFLFQIFSKYYDGEGDTIIKDPRVFRIVNIVKIVLLSENSND